MSEEHEVAPEPQSTLVVSHDIAPAPAPVLFPPHVGQRADAVILLGRGRSIKIPARQMTPEMAAARPAWRESLGLEVDDPPVVEGFIPILRAYVRHPRGLDPMIKAEVAEDGSSVTVTALALGAASVDVIDQASDPAGTTAFDAFHDFIVVR